MPSVKFRPVDYHLTLQNLWQSWAFRALFFMSVAITFVVSPLVYWSLDTTQPFVYLTKDSDIIPDPAAGGQQVIVRWKVKWNRACPGIVRRQLFDPRTNVVLALYDPAPASLDRPPGDQLNKTFLLPHQMQNGRIGYRARLEYHCNPLQFVFPLIFSTPDLYFTVEDRG
jgi:hypothetical protein